MGQIDQLELDGWQALLDRHAEVFQDMEAGARIGVLSKDAFEPPATMVVWQATEQGMQAGYEPFPGFERVKIDLLFIADEATILGMHDSVTDAPFGQIRSKLRRRDILLYVVKPHRALLDAGYENFLESLGLPVLGTCR
ncbi:MAG: hypothetical protein R3D62_16895 [Xanthobacteraceae bacterium]